VGCLYMLILFVLRICLPHRPNLQLMDSFVCLWNMLDIKRWLNFSWMISSFSMSIPMISHILLAICSLMWTVWPYLNIAMYCLVLRWLYQSNRIDCRNHINHLATLCTIPYVLVCRDRLACCEIGSICSLANSCIKCCSNQREHRRKPINLFT
jgi:hypothetical protein